MTDSAQTPKVKGVVDLVFLIDATGSMGSLIDALRDGIRQFIDRLTSGGEQSVTNWRAKVVGYRDLTVDPSTWFEDHPFTREAEELRRQLGGTQAASGGDNPESTFDAIYAVATMPASAPGTEDPGMWRDAAAAARVILCFTDEVSHSTLSHPNALGGTVEDVKHALVSNRVRLVLYAPDDQDYHALAGARGVVMEPTADLRGLATDPAAFDEAMKALVKTVTVIAAPPAL